MSDTLQSSHQVLKLNIILPKDWTPLRKNNSQKMCNQLLISKRNMAGESNWGKIWRWIFARSNDTRECPPPLGSRLIVPPGSRIFSRTRIVLQRIGSVADTSFFNCYAALLFLKGDWIKHSLERYSWKRWVGWKHRIDNDALKIRGSHSIGKLYAKP